MVGGRGDGVMDGALTGRVAFVTDGWFGLGASITDSLLAAGALVGVGYRKPERALDRFAARREDRPITLHQGSISDPEDCRAAVDELVAKRDRIDILIAKVNFAPAGIFSPRRSLSQLGDREWHRAIDVNVTGALHIAQAALRHMTAAGSGRIIFVVGTAGVGDGQGHHATVRGALRTLTVALARDVARTGVTVNQVYTGLFNDELLSALPDGVLDQAIARVPVKRLAEPHDITRAIQFFAHPDSGYLTGQALYVDGGLTIDTI